MSLSSKLITLGSVLAMACGTPSSRPANQNISSVVTEQGVTNEKGKVFFKDGSEEVEITVYDLGCLEELAKNQCVVSNAKVNFANGNGFEVFTTRHADYIPSLDIFPHNSSHEIYIKKKELQFTKFDQARFENPTKDFIIPMNIYMAAIKDDLQYVECQSREDFISNYKDSLTIISYVASAGGGGPAVDKLFSVIGKSADYILKASDILELKETEIVHLYSTKSIVADFDSLIKGGFIEKEKCNDGVDNDCNGSIDGNDETCKPGYVEECVKTNKTCISENKFQYGFSCEGFEVQTGTCHHTMKCVDGECVDKSCTYSHKECYNSSSVVSVDSCGGKYDVVACDWGEYCVDGSCLEEEVNCSFDGYVCFDGNTKAKIDTCGKQYDFVDCDDVCMDGACVGGNCEFDKFYCTDVNSYASKDTCGKILSTGDCSSGDKCEDGKCVEGTSSCDDMPIDWGYCECPEQHDGSQCHKIGAYDVCPED